jgi:hypothetical protein
MVGALAQHTALTSAQAEDVAACFEQRFEERRGELGATVEQVKGSALQAVATTGKRSSPSCSRCRSPWSPPPAARWAARSCCGVATSR